MRINNFQGDLTDMSAEKQPLVCTRHVSAGFYAMISCLGEVGNLMALLNPVLLVTELSLSPPVPSVIFLYWRQNVLST